MNKLIDGAMFRKMVNYGAKNLEINKGFVDSLNVFPVPDGDTGSNMFLTILSAVKEVNSVAEDNILEIASALSKGALKGARGNSGVILSQILKGFIKAFTEEKPINTRMFAKALKMGTEVAYSAVTKPKEGTILTVVRVMAEHAGNICAKTTDFRARGSPRRRRSRRPPRPRASARPSAKLRRRRSRIFLRAARRGNASPRARGRAVSECRAAPRG